MNPPPGPGNPGGGVGRVVVTADGGSRGNPGPAGYGTAVVDESGAVLAERAGSLGTATNNVAEYSGLIAGLEAARAVGARAVTVRMDFKLVIEQMSGRWKGKYPDLVPLAVAAAALVDQFDAVDFVWVPRADNAHADRLANKAMDAAAAGRTWAPTAEPPADKPPADEPLGDEPLGDEDPAAALPHPDGGRATRFVLVRHGETTWSARGRFAGRQDVPLTARGRQQAAAVAERVRPAAPDAVVTSPLLRCQDTARAIGAASGADVVVDNRLTDGTLGKWTGCRASEIERRWPAAFQAWRSDPEATPPGGESFNQIRMRVRSLLMELRDAHRGGTVVLVSHAATTKMILVTALDVDSAVAYRLRVDTGSLSGFTIEADNSVTVWAVNETGHLAPVR